MLKKYKSQVEEHVHGPDCGHDHGHDAHDHHHGHDTKHEHVHGPNCGHDHSHDAHHHHEHGHDGHDDMQALFEERDFAMLIAELQSHGHDHSYDLALCDWETTQSPAALTKLEQLSAKFGGQTHERCVALVNLGLIYKQKNQNDKAKTALDEALKLARRDEHLQAERKAAEEALATLNVGSLKDKMLSLFK